MLHSRITASKHGARIQSKKLQVWILPGSLLYTGLGTASSILKFCLLFMIIAPYTISAKTKTMISIDNIFMTNVVFTNYVILWNSFSSHCSIEKHYIWCIYYEVLTEYFFLNRLHIALSRSCILTNGLQYFGTWLNQVFYAFWLKHELV